MPPLPHPFSAPSWQDVEEVIYEDSPTRTASNSGRFTTLGGIYRTCSYGASLLTRENRWVLEGCSGGLAL